MDSYDTSVNADMTESSLVTNNVEKNPSSEKCPAGEKNPSERLTNETRIALFEDITVRNEESTKSATSLAVQQQMVVSQDLATRQFSYLEAGPTLLQRDNQRPATNFGERILLNTDDPTISIGDLYDADANTVIRTSGWDEHELRKFVTTQKMNGNQSGIRICDALGHKSRQLQHKTECNTVVMPKEVSASANLEATGSKARHAQNEQLVLEYIAMNAEEKLSLKALAEKFNIARALAAHPNCNLRVVDTIVRKNQCDIKLVNVSSSAQKDQSIVVGMASKLLEYIGCKSSGSLTDEDKKLASACQVQITSDFGLEENVVSVDKAREYFQTLPSKVKGRGVPYRVYGTDLRTVLKLAPLEKLESEWKDIEKRKDMFQRFVEIASPKNEAGALTQQKENDKSERQLSKTMAMKNDEAKPAGSEMLDNKAPNNVVPSSLDLAGRMKISIVFEKGSRGASEGLACSQKDDKNKCDTKQGIECAACTEILDEFYFFTLSSCGHEFCRECLEQLVDHAIVSDGIMKCFDPNCQQDLLYEDVELLAEPEMLVLYNQKLFSDEHVAT